MGRHRAGSDFDREPEDLRAPSCMYVYVCICICKYMYIYTIYKTCVPLSRQWARPAARVTRRATAIRPSQARPTAADSRGRHRHCRGAVAVPSASNTVQPD
jgi:hypothetical protein